MAQLSSRRRFLLTAVASVSGLTTGCGTFLYPERLGQPRSGPIDWKVAALDGIGLILFVVPGAIAFAVDWYTGTLFLPEYGYGTTSQPQPEFISQSLEREQLTREGIESAVLRQTGQTVSLEPGTYRTRQLSQIDEFVEAVRRLETEGMSASKRSAIAS